MSASLLRRGLELLEPPGRAKAPLGLQRGQAGRGAAGAARRRKRSPEPGTNKATVKGRVVKSAIEEYHKKKPVNHLRKNLQYMLKGRLVADEAVTEQLENFLNGLPQKVVSCQDLKRRIADRARILGSFYEVLAQNRGRKSKDQPPEKTEQKKPEGTVFTEEDFRKFEREYFGVP